MRPQQPDQFSQEYIAFIFSDEAKGLHKGHVWDLGDHFVMPHERGEVVYLLGYEEQRCRFKKAGTDKVAVWLPDLYSLLQIIEGAGWVVLDINFYHDEKGVPRMEMMGAAECVEWAPDSYGPMNCVTCGGDLFGQLDGTFTYGSRPERVEDYDNWDSSLLPTCPHCACSGGLDLMFAAAKLAVRAIGGKEQSDGRNSDMDIHV